MSTGPVGRSLAGLVAFTATSQGNIRSKSGWRGEPSLPARQRRFRADNRPFVGQREPDAGLLRTRERCDHDLRACTQDRLVHPLA
jgi:hypothetical protein